MVLFSASSAALSFAFDKLLNIKYSIVYGVGALPHRPQKCWLSGAALPRILLIVASLCLLYPASGGRTPCQAAAAYASCLLLA